MKLFTKITFFLGLSFSTFGWWGLFTKSGSTRFDEMDGYIPFIGLMFGIGLISVALIMVTLLAITKRSRKSK